MKRVAFAQGPSVRVVISRIGTALFALLALLSGPPAWADHPMLTEDTVVLEAGVWEAELHGERTRDREAGVTTRGSDVTARLARGIARDVHFQVELPYVREVTDGVAVDGRGDAMLGFKWRFHDRDGLSLAFKPDLLLPTGRDEAGLGAGRVRWAANALAACELASLELIGHLGYTHNRNRISERVELWHVSIALRWSATEKLKLVADLGRDSNPDPGARSASRDLILGLMYALRDNVDLGLGLQKGLNDTADDRAVRAGVKLRW